MCLLLVKQFSLNVTCSNPNINFGTELLGIFAETHYWSSLLLWFVSPAQEQKFLLPAALTSCCKKFFGNFLLIWKFEKSWFNGRKLMVGQSHFCKKKQVSFECFQLLMLRNIFRYNKNVFMRASLENF